MAAKCLCSRCFERIQVAETPSRKKVVSSALYIKQKTNIMKYQLNTNASDSNCLKFNLFYETSRILVLSQFVWTLRSSV